MIGKGKKDKIFFLSTLIIFTLVFLTGSLVYASYSAGDKKSFIQNSYFSGQKIEGWINISFTNENAKSDLTDSFGNKVNLINFLKKHSGLNYTCTPSSCDDIYTLTDAGSESKSVSLSNEKTIGVVLNGKNVDVSNFEFSGTSNIGDSCGEQLAMDISDDGSSDWGNINYVQENCGAELKSLCYTGIFQESVSINKVPYCEKIKLKKAPAFEIKVNVKKSNTPSEFYNGLLKGWIYDSEGNLNGNCDFNNPTTSFSQIKCIVNFIPEKEADYYICISYEEAANNPQGYDLQARLSGNYCGFLGDPKETSEFNGDYNIIASAKKFAALSNFKLNETSFMNNDQDSLVDYINNYITEKYSKDCSQGVGCVVPIKLSGLSQGLTFNNLKLEYSSQGSAGTTSKLFYDVQKENAKINSPYIKLDLRNADFSTPTNVGNYTWRLFVNGQVFDEANISVSGEKNKVILQVYPRDVPVATSTTFSAFLDKDINLSGTTLVWNFGDNTQEQTTNGNKVKHTYNALGNYTLKIKVLRGDDEISLESFQIKTKSPKDVINTTIINYKSDISKTESDMNSLSEDYRKIIRDNYLTDLTQTKNALGGIDSEYKRLLADSTTKDEQYVTLMNSLNQLKVPSSIQESQRSSFNFIYNAEDVDLEKIVKLFNEYYKPGEEDAYKSAISEWYLENLNVTLNHRVISIYYKDNIEDAISEFNFNIKPLSSIDYPVYVLIEEDVNDAIINSSSRPVLEEGYTGIKFDKISGSEKFTIASEGRTDAFDLPVYVLPKLNELTISSNNGTGGKPKSFWKTFLPWVIALLILALVIYIFLQQWYKRKYEIFLFKNKNEIYNLLFFIGNAKGRGLNDKQIVEQLKKAGWKSEKIDYAIKKFYGKRTGMWEIPILSWFEKRKIKQEMLKRQKPRTAF
ncbi:MAG: PKD domain-containing protein [Nanoarchaeota archaeon]